MSTSFATNLLWLPALLAMAVAALAAGWPRRSRVLRVAAPTPTGLARPTEPALAGAIDVAAEICTVLSRLEMAADRLYVKFTVAVQPGLLAHADPAAFRQVLTDLLNSAVNRAPCGQVLLAAGLQGGRVQICVSDDGPVLGRQVTESALRGASQLTALQGGTLDIDLRPGEGTITTIRLSGLSAAAPASAPAAARPAGSVALA